MQKLLTVIVPSYNMEAYLPKCLGSLVVGDERLLARLDVVVVNDGSKDRTGEIAHEFAARHPGVFRVLDKPNGHYGSCINVALPSAAGTFVKVLDADDSVETESLASLLALLERAAAEPDVDLVVSDYAQVDTEGRVRKTVHFGLPADRSLTLDDVPARLPRFTLHTLCYRTALLAGLHYRQTEGVPYTDTEWIILPMAAVRHLRYHPAAVTHYLLGRDGQTMDNAVFAHDFHIFLVLAEGVAKWYEADSAKFEASSRAYCRRQLAIVLRMAYWHLLEGWRGHRVSGDLGAFDAAIRRLPRVDAVAREVRLPLAGMPFHFIRVWRRAPALFKALATLYKAQFLVVSRLAGEGQ
ncbi:MAG: glycosyltransferase family 2 protein [Kiritimatiellae bacterium]|nr:glycosyltransferase family 2 protein [Kiritimatiellia bacterium]